MSRNVTLAIFSGVDCLKMMILLVEDSRFMRVASERVLLSVQDRVDFL